MAGSVSISTARRVRPKIYAYTTPEIKRHEGWTKIGYTEKDVEGRIKQQSGTVDVVCEILWEEDAVYRDGSGDVFRDTDFHAYLRRNGIPQEPGKSNEWFRISGTESHRMFEEFVANRGVRPADGAIPYTLRAEQEEAVSKACDYFELNDRGEFLWNAKPRFGKTLAVYDLCRRAGVTDVLIVTNRPAIANSWYNDFCRFMGDESGYRFVSASPALESRPSVHSREGFDRLRKKDPSLRCVEFMSLQDLKGSIYFGGTIDKLKYVAEQDWGLLVIDEAHEGVDTYRTDVAFDHVNRKWTLHLSGTPFKALANEKFPEGAIFNWTYSDEQKAKACWRPISGEENPYADLPRLSMFTYQMSNIVESEVRQGIRIGDEVEEYAFDLNEFFATNRGRFVHDDAVDAFLDALASNEKFPFSTEELRGSLRHTLWLLNRVDSAKALYKKLKAHRVFGGYGIVLAAGDGKVDDDDENMKAYDRVVKAISEHDRTITLSVGQLTTGVTIPEWTAVLMLSNINSPALYMQAAFRAQNPCLFRTEEGFYRKENAYVFDFDPARTLTIYENFANGLSPETSSGRGDSGTRRSRVRELLNFFPVIGEDEDGRMIELDAEKVLSIPRRIRSIEVVRRGFMSNFLFQNIGSVFHAPPAVWELINSFEPSREPEPVAYSVGMLDLDEDGEVSVPREKVIGTATDLFGEKIYVMDPEDAKNLLDFIDDLTMPSEADEQIRRVREIFSESVTSPMIDAAKEKFGKGLTPSAEKALERKINASAEAAAKKAVSSFRIAQRTLDADMRKELDVCDSDAERKAVERKYSEKREAAAAEFGKGLGEDLEALKVEAGREIVDRVITDRQQREKKGIEDSVKDHLRGFSRTIPSFLMAYGSEGEVTLSNFDRIVPDNVFREVTGISLDDFRFLRDGGPYTDPETGEEGEFKGQLFDPVVFDDSVKEFLALKRRLANYFDESQEGDIFDYVPPQRTNQIFTPKAVVRDMVDRLEELNPGCFDDDTKKFADLYMKSGLYLAEIVRRLYSSERMRELHPDDGERLRHIFAEQVYGLAPTEIIHRITVSFLPGFGEDVEIPKHNLRQCDALQYADGDKLRRKLEELYDLDGAVDD